MAGGIEDGEKSNAYKKEMLKWFEEVPRWMKWFEATLVYAAALTIGLWMLSFTLFVIGTAFEKLGELIGIPNPIPAQVTIASSCSRVMRGWSEVYKGLSMIVLSVGYFLLYGLGAIMANWFKAAVTGVFSVNAVELVRSFFWRDGPALGTFLATIWYPFGVGIRQLRGGINDIWWGSLSVIYHMGVLGLALVTNVVIVVSDIWEVIARTLGTILAAIWHPFGVGIRQLRRRTIRQLRRRINRQLRINGIWLLRFILRFILIAVLLVFVLVYCAVVAVLFIVVVIDLLHHDD